MWHGLYSAVTYIWGWNPGGVKRTLCTGAAPLAFMSCPLQNPDCWIAPMCFWTPQTLLPCQLFHSSLAFLFHCSPHHLLLRLNVTLLPGLPALPGLEVVVWRIPRWQLEGGSRSHPSYSEILERCWRHTLQAKPPRRGKTLEVVVLCQVCLSLPSRVPTT
jgi:hypothetical protein